MGAAAVSFEVRGGNLTTLTSSVARAVASVDTPTSVWMFTSGKHANLLESLAQELNRRFPDLPILLLSGSGVLSDRGELDGEDASTGVVWRGGSVHFRHCNETDLHNQGLAALTGEVPGYSPLCLFVKAEHFRPDMLAPSVGLPPLFGAATYGTPGLVVCDGSGVNTPSAVVVHARGLGRPAVQTAHSCRLLSAPLPITRCEGAMVFELGGEAALTVLERLGAKLSGRPLLFTVLCEASETAMSPNAWLVRGIQGIDPARRALMITPELELGMRMTFAVKDSLAARSDLERRCRQAAVDLRGGVPRFGFFFSCSGRGRHLYSTPGVDARILRERFPNTPFAGFHSAFEISPFGDVTTFQIYTGVLTLFSAPS
jgi:small ligand-binding sensory domain FIST